MKDYYKGKIVYRIVTWEEHPRQEREYTIIKSSYIAGSDWEDVKGFDTLDEAKKHLIKLGVEL